MKIIILSFILLVLNIASFAGQRYWEKGDPFPKLKSGSAWAKLSRVVVTATVTVNNGNCNYSYTVYSSTKNRLPIYFFEIDLRENILSHPFQPIDLSSSHSASEHMLAVANASRNPVSETSSPVLWEPVINQESNLIFGRWTMQHQFVEGDMLKPGKQLSGFGFLSQMPVGLREYMAEAYIYEYTNLDFDVPQDKLAFYTMSQDLGVEVAKGLEYYGKTIAPVAPPEPFTASSWTARMAEYAAEARKQKWIKTDKTLAEIKKLISALNTEDKGKLKEAVKKTESYVLAEKKKGNLTDEADALVRLNALYLLGRLGSPGEKPNDGANK